MKRFILRLTNRETWGEYGWVKRFIQPPKKVGLREVAQLAGVSLACASHALNGNGSLTETTRQRVKAAAERLGYWPSLAAKALKGNKGKTILIFTDGLAGPWYGELLEGLQVALVESGYSVLASTMGTQALDLCRGLVSDALVPGIVIVNPEAARREDWRAFLDRVPSVVFDAEIGFDASVRFSLDSRPAMEKLVEHLWNGGCRDYLWLDGKLETSSEARERWAAFSNALETRADGAFELRRADAQYSAVRAKAVVGTILDEQRRPDAIVAANDESAFGALEALAARSVRVPNDVKVAGFDGVDAAAWFSVPLTTLAFDRRALGRSMAAALLGELDPEGESNPFRTIPVDFVHRAST